MPAAGTSHTEAGLLVEHASRRSLWAVSAGTFFEWYDFLCYVSLLGYFGPLFFPSNDPAAAILGSLVTFAIGMLARPLGALYFGSLGDRYGRRRVLILTLFIMGAATISIGLLPTYETAGLVATSLLFALRITQGFAVGGEIGGAVAYVYEYAPSHKKGVYGAMLPVMIPSAMLVASLQIIFLENTLGVDAVRSWGWRIPFLLSGLLLAATILWRLSLVESPAYLALRTKMSISKAPVLDCLRDSKIRRQMAVTFFCVSAAASITFFTASIYTPLYLKSAHKISEGIATQAYLFSMLFFFPSTIFFGHLSDRIGRRRVFLGGIAAAIVVTPLVFTTLSSSQDPPTLIALTSLLMIAAGATNGPLVAILGNLFHVRTRYTAIGLAHNLSAGWIGGLAPLIMTYLVSVTEYPFAGIGYLIAVLLVAWIVAWYCLEKSTDDAQ